MAEQRPDPEQLLERLKREEERERRAKLKVFFGAAAGVGKTYAMLAEAHERRAAGVDVVAGVVETHGREETGRLLDGLESLPLRSIEYRGASLPEFDLDAALARKPALILVDELAHSNVPGSRHTKRWQDVDELLAAGIDVYTTLNVQHVDSLNDVVAQITGVTVRETVPDLVLDRADEIELIDLPPDDLLQRLREGKVYVPAQAEAAMRSFFRKGNLIALRELALRRTAERVDAEMESYRREAGIAEPWAVRDRILVCVGDPEMGLRLVRSARRMVTGLRAQWIVAHVETPAELRWPRDRRDYIVDVMGFAEDLGAETVILQGIRVADEILALAAQRNVSRILVGKPSRPRWQQLLGGSLAENLVRNSREADVYVITGETEGPSPARTAEPSRFPGWGDILQAVAVVALSTGLSFLLFGRLDLTNLIMIYLLGLMVVALWVGRVAAVLASILSVAAFDFFFVPPRFTFAVADTQYLVTFGVMLMAALALSTMAHWVRVQAEAARLRERRTAALYRMSRELAELRTSDDLLSVAARGIGEEFGGRAAILLPSEGGGVRLRVGDLGTAHHERHDAGVAQWTFDNGQPAGLGTATLPGARGLYLPLLGSSGPIGVLGLIPGGTGAGWRPDQFRFLETMASQIALAVERGHLAESAEQARVRDASARLKDTLLSSISHDFRTPLAVIAGAASSLRDRRDLPETLRQELEETIVDEASRLSRQVSGLLDMTRLESGAIEVHKEWHSLEEVVGSTLGRLNAPLAGRDVRVDVHAVPYAPMDDVLIGQVLFNLVENATKYTPAGSPIEIRASREGEGVVIEVADRGPGLPEADAKRVFEKFYRAVETGPRGLGLGLSISRGFVEAHGGRIEAMNRPGGGVAFRIWLPIEGQPPHTEDDAGANQAGVSVAQS